MYKGLICSLRPPSGNFISCLVFVYISDNPHETLLLASAAQGLHEESSDVLVDFHPQNTRGSHAFRMRHAPSLHAYAACIPRDIGMEACVMNSSIVHSVAGPQNDTCIK